DVDDAGAVRRRDVADIGDPLAHDHLPAAITIEVADDLYTVTMPAVHAQPDEGRFDKTLSCACACGQPIGLGGARARSCIHSISASARAMSGGGISRPSAFAVFRLMTSSNRVGCSTGRSAGLVSLSTSAVYAPCLRYKSGRCVP